MLKTRLIQGVVGLSMLALVATGCGTATGAAVGAIYDVTHHNR